MKHTIELTDEQLEELDSILSRELRESKGELRHTWDSNYKERVRRHIEVVESMSRDVEACRQSQPHGSVSD